MSRSPISDRMVLAIAADHAAEGTACPYSPSMT